MIDYYEFLQISPHADPETVHRVYRYLAGRFHPDNPESGDANLFCLVKAAYDVLSDPAKRAEYDTTRRNQPVEAEPFCSSVDFMDDLEGELNRRVAVLAVLYRRRRTNPDGPEVTLVEIEARMGFPRDYLDFTLWYLVKKRYVTRTDNAQFTLTAEGVDFVETQRGSIPVLNKMLTTGSTFWARRLRKSRIQKRFRKMRARPSRWAPELRKPVRVRCPSFCLQSRRTTRNGAPVCLIDDEPKETVGLIPRVDVARPTEHLLPHPHPQGFHLAVKMAPLQPQQLGCPAHVIASFLDLLQDEVALICYKVADYHGSSHKFPGIAGDTIQRDGAHISGRTKHTGWVSSCSRLNSRMDAAQGRTIGWVVVIIRPMAVEDAGVIGGNPGHRNQ